VLHDLIGGFASCLQPYNMLMLFLGTGLGLVVGALPGLSSPMAIIVLLPLTYPMEPLPALLSMMGVYVGTKLGGSFSAILLRTPGTPAGACTALDGYPMTMRGEAGLALGYSTVGATLGGIFGWVVAVTCVPLLAAVAVKSTNADIALVGVLGLVMVTAFIRASMLRGLIGVVLGLLIGTVGLDPISGNERFTFGLYQLLSGIPFAAVMVGLFGFAVVIADIPLIGQKSELLTSKVRLKLPTARDLAKRWQAILIGALYGVGIGAVPGIGAEASPWMAYGTVRSRSKQPEKFGTGVPEGILAPEASANGVTGGTMVPMLTLGIPGDSSTAIMLGALILHGIAPGITLMRDDGPLVWGLLAGLLISTILMFLIAWKTIPWFVRILANDRGWLFPFIVVLATLGSFSSMNDYFPVWVAAAFGVIGWIMEARGLPVVTVVLGVILGPIIEQNARTALALAHNEWSTFVATGPRIGLVICIFALVAWETWRHFAQRAAPQPEVNLEKEGGAA
jgi:putative tricarboxylic transport membrane protein